MRRVYEKVDGKMTLVDYVYTIKNKRIVGKRMLAGEEGVGGSGSEAVEAMVEKTEGKKGKGRKKK